jgi:hypothetical protein
MLTDRISGFVSGLIGPRFSAEAEAIIARYGPPPPTIWSERLREGALDVAHAVALIPFFIVLAAVGALTGTGLAGPIAVFGAAFLVGGLVLHTARLELAWFAPTTHRRRWPLSSSDVDFVVQAAAAAIVTALA